jgi:hypothetical protein
LTALHRIEEGREVAPPVPLALLALALPASAAAAPKRGQDIDPVACPGPGQSVPVSVSVRVPSWARMPAQVAFALPTGTCGATASPARDLAITPGKAGNHRDAWGRKESTLRFSFDLSDGTGTGTVTPSVTAGWS